MSVRYGILIHLDEYRRDAAVLFALRRLLMDAGCEVVLSTRRTTPLWLRQRSFDAIVVPSLEHIPYDWIPELSVRSKIYMLPTEGALFDEWPLLVKYGGGHESERWERHIQATARFFLWGEYSRSILRATGRFRDDQLIVVGAQRMDFFLAEPSPSESQAFDCSSIGAISNFLLLNTYLPGHVFQTVDRGRTGHGYYYARSREFEDRYWIESAWVRVWLELLDECKRRGESIQLRIHPREDLGAYGYLQTKYGSTLQLAGQELPFEVWMDRLGVLLSYNSTALFEAAAAEKPAFSLEGLVGDRLAEHIDGFPMAHYPIMDHLEAPRSFDALFDLIGQVRDGRWTGQAGYRPELRALLKDVCHFPRRSSTLATITQTIISDLDAAPATTRRSSRAATMAGKVKSRALETATFAIRRDRVISSWFPLVSARLERALAQEIARYLRAAARFPAGGQEAEAVAEVLPVSPCADL